MKLETKNRLHRWNVTLTSTYVVIVLSLAVSAYGQASVSYQYFYDDLGQLTKIVDSTGTVVEYVYDPVGNILQIKRSSVTPTILAIFNFTPQSGGPTQTVTIQGQAFDPTPANDIVQFNGTTAHVLSASPTTLAVAVPVGATTGPISVTVAGQKAISTSQFTVIGLPVITGMSCKSALFHATIPNLQVSGFNLSGATFAFAPSLTPPAIVVSSASINPSGTSANISLTTGSSAGTYILVATNSFGSSSLVASSSYRFTAVNPFSTADTSGNGFPDVLKAAFCSDILDPNSIPLINNGTFEADSLTVSLLNGAAPPHPSPSRMETDSLTVSLVNGIAPPPPPPQLKESDSLTVSLLNGIAPTAPRPAFHEVDSLTTSLLNGVTPPVQPIILEADSLTISLFNSSAKTTSRTPGGNQAYAALNQHHQQNLNDETNVRKRSSAKPKPRKQMQSNGGD